MKIRGARFRGLLTLTAVSSLVIMGGTVASGSVSKSSNSSSQHSKSPMSSSQPYKIALSMSYTGNDWQSEAENLVKATAKTPPYNKKVSLRVDIAGTSVTNQIATINNEVAAGMNAIIVYPLSPTALNPAIEQACKRGVVVFAYDSLVTAPCAYNVHPNIVTLGYSGAHWLVQKMHGKGNLVIIRGVAGTSADLEEYAGVLKAIKGTAIKVVAQPVGNWDSATIKLAFSSVYAANPDINGVWGTTGCVQVRDIVAAATHPIYCSGGVTEGEMMLMAPKSVGGQGVTTDAAVPAPPYDGELAFLLAVQVLEGQKVLHDTILPTPAFTSSQVKFGTNPAKGATVYPTSVVPTGFFGDFWNPVVEEGLYAALKGTPNKISSPKPCSAVPGCSQQAKMTINKEYPGGN